MMDDKPPTCNRVRCNEKQIYSLYIFSLKSRTQGRSVRKILLNFYESTNNPVIKGAVDCGLYYMSQYFL